MSAIDYQALAQALIAGGLAGEIAKGIAPPEPLLSREQIAHAFGVTPVTIDRWRRAGMPCVMLGSMPRFDRAACLTWATKQKEARPTENPFSAHGSAADLQHVRVTSRR